MNAEENPLSPHSTTTTPQDNIKATVNRTDKVRLVSAQFMNYVARGKVGREVFERDAVPEGTNQTLTGDSVH